MLKIETHLVLTAESFNVVMLKAPFELPVLMWKVKVALLPRSSSEALTVISDPTPLGPENQRLVPDFNGQSTA